MRKFWKIFMIILDVIVVAAIIVGLIYAVQWVRSHGMIDAGDVFGGIQ